MFTTRHLRPAFCAIQLFLLFLPLGTFGQEGNDACLLPVTDPRALFGQSPGTEPQVLSSVRAPDYSECIAECCNNEEACNVAIHLPTSDSDTNCNLYYCSTISDCNIPIMDANNDTGQQIFADKDAVTELLAQNTNNITTTTAAATENSPTPALTTPHNGGQATTTTATKLVTTTPSGEGEGGEGVEKEASGSTQESGNGTEVENTEQKLVDQNSTTTPAIQSSVTAVLQPTTPKQQQDSDVTTKEGTTMIPLTTNSGNEGKSTTAVLTTKQVAIGSTTTKANTVSNVKTTNAQSNTESNTLIPKLQANSTTPQQGSVTPPPPNSTLSGKEVVRTTKTSLLTTGKSQDSNITTMQASVRTTTVENVGEVAQNVTNLPTASPHTNESSSIENPASEFVSNATQQQTTVSTLTPEAEVTGQGLGMRGGNNTQSDNNSPFDQSATMTAVLISALSLGCFFFFVALVLVGNRFFTSWKNRQYSRIQADYLVDGMYHE